MNIDFYLELIKDYKHQIETNNEYKEKNRKLKELIKIEWYGDDPNSNRNQKSELQDYKTIHIKIAPPTLEEKLEMKLKYISYKKLAEMFIRELCICDLDILFENLPDISKIHDNKCRKCWDIVLENNDNEYDNSI